MDPITSHTKLSKSKGKIVKPILKKLSHSEKNSLDLDRPWEEQQGPGFTTGGLASWNVSFEPTGSARSARDVSFALADSPAYMSKRFQHGRSLSGASHVSVATSASGGASSRPGGFVHPFQQLPQAQTPSLGFASSSPNLDMGNVMGSRTPSMRDYSPTITENEDDDPPGSLPTQRQLHGRGSSISQSSVRHPSLASQRTASFSDVSTAPSLRINTSRASGRRAYGGSSGLASSQSHSDLHLSSITPASPTVFDSPISTGSTVPPPAVPATPMHSTPLLPLRGSLDSVVLPRLRSRSELDAGARAEEIREARRKFEERERIKAEKHEREMRRKRERRDHKEAKEMERQAAAQVAQLRKNSGTGSDMLRPSLPQKPVRAVGGGAISGGSSSSGGSGEHGHGRRHGRAHGRISGHDDSRQGGRPARLEEKPLAFKSSNYDNMAGGTAPSYGPNVDSVAFKNARRQNSAKHKTQGYWTGFVLWLRTRLFRLGRK